MSKVLSFGFGGFGSLSNGSVSNQPIPDVSETLTNLHVQKVSSGLWHSLIISESHVLYAVGRGRYGALGMGDVFTQDEFNSLQPRQIPEFAEASVRIVDCAAGKTHSLAVSAGGQLYSWGFGNGTGQGSPSLISSPNMVPSMIMHKVIQVSAGSHISACLNNKGKCFIWGGDIRNPIQVKDARIDNEVCVKVVCGEKHWMVLTESGKLFGMGQNSDFQISGKNESSDLTEIECPTSINDANLDEVSKYTTSASSNTTSTAFVRDSWKDVFCGLKHTVAVAKKGHIYVWGWIRPGCGENSGHLKQLTRMTLPKDVDIPNIKSVFSGYSSIGFLTYSGSVYMQGYNEHGNLGLGDFKHRSKFERIGVLDSLFVEKIFYGGYNGYVVAGSSCTHDFENLLHKGTHSDLLIKGEIVEYKAHRSVLAARSPVLAKMIQEMDSSDSVLSLEFVPDHLLEHVLHLIYTNIALNVGDDAESNKELLDILQNKLEISEPSITGGVLSSHRDLYSCQMVYLSENRADFYPDIRIRFDDGQVIHAHKGILSARSYYFNSMFSAGMLEAHSNEILFSEASREAFEVLLRFLYCGIEEVPVESSVELLLLASSIDCGSWKAKIEHVIIQNLDPSNVVDVILVSDLCDAKGLKTACVHFIAENYGKEPELAERVKQELQTQGVQDLIKHAIQEMELMETKQLNIEKEELRRIAEMRDILERGGNRHALANPNNKDTDRVTSILGGRNNKGNKGSCSVM